jgi:rhodanese-related sulfurtransferase
VKFFVDNWGLILLAFVSGGMLLWPAILRQRAGAVVNATGATRLMNDGAIVLDVRDSGEFAAGHLPNSRNIPTVDIEKRVGELASGKPVLVVCANGQRAGRAAITLRKSGRDPVYCLEGGVAAWRTAGLPIVK